MVNYISLSGKRLKTRFGKIADKTYNGLTVFILVVCLCQFFISANGFSSDKTTSVSSIKVLKALSKENNFYTIDNTAHIDGNYYRFLLTAPHGEYNILSIKDLLKVCNEIRIIEEFRATDEGEQAWNGAGESLKNIGRGAKQIVKNPKESARAFGRAGKKLFRGIGRLFSGKDDTKAADGSDRAEGAKGMFVGKQSRLFATEVGLDVYTDNPYAKALIEEVAKQRAKGAIGTSVGLFFLAPVAGLGLLSNSLTPDGFDTEIENLIRNESPAELSYLITEKYKNKLGIKSEKDNKVLTDLIKNGNYTPREQAYIYFHLERLTKPVKGNGIDGLMDAIKHLGKVKTPNDATFASIQLELLSAYQQHDKNLVRFVITANMLGSIDNDKHMFLIIPYDIAGNSSGTQKVLDKIGNAAESCGVKDTKLWITGEALKGFIKKAKLKGIMVKDNVLLLPHFAPAGSA